MKWLVLRIALFAEPFRLPRVRVMISAGFFGVYVGALVPRFERSTGHKLVTTRGPSMGDSPEAIPTRLARGETADVVICDGHANDELAAARPGSRRQQGRARPSRRSAWVVREGAAKPDISTVDAFKKTLLAAKSIAYSDSGSGTHLSTKLFPQLGVADQIAGKSRKSPRAALWRAGGRGRGAQRIGDRLPAGERADPREGHHVRRHDPGRAAARILVCRIGERESRAARSGRRAPQVPFVAQAAPVITKAGLAPARADGEQSVTFGEVEGFIDMLLAACEDKSMNATLEMLLRSRIEKRKAIVHRLLDRLKEKADAPQALIRRWRAPWTTTPAEKAYAVIFQCKRRME